MQDKDGNIIDRREMLRVKVKSLAAEAQIIRREERRSKYPLRGELHRHRVEDVRSEARHTHLAYGLVRGRKVEQIERTSKVEPDWKRVRAMLTRYGPFGKEWDIPGAPPAQVRRAA